MVTWLMAAVAVSTVQAWMSMGWGSGVKMAMMASGSGVAIAERVTGKMGGRNEGRPAWQVQRALFASDRCSKEEQCYVCQGAEEGA